jgi:hypothetical protein
MYLYSYPATHGISGLAAGGIGDEFGGAPENEDLVNTKIHSEALMERV